MYIFVFAFGFVFVFCLYLRHMLYQSGRLRDLIRKDSCQISLLECDSAFTIKKLFHYFNLHFQPLGGQLSDKRAISITADNTNKWLFTHFFGNIFSVWFSLFFCHFFGLKGGTRKTFNPGDGVFFQVMEWPIARAITGDERVDIQLLAHNRFTVFFWEYLFKYSIMFVW